MDISKEIARLKALPEFTENVGMVLVHNGVVRGWSRQSHDAVEYLEVVPDHARIEELRQEFLKRPGIFTIVIEALEGRFQPGDDLLFIIVAGALREDVKPVLAELLDRVKAEAVTKKEIVSG
ncbi:MAG: molybdenum cofactor biosynthesis protein MoaE [Thermodesulfobacteriota bacterium]